MDSSSDLIRRIVSRSGVVTSRARGELERELRAHLEDAIEDLRSRDVDEARLSQIVCGRFGDPNQIAREFSNLHRLERWTMTIARSVTMLLISVLAVAGVILTIQLFLAIFSGASPLRAFPHLREQSIGFASLTLGYMGLYFQERLSRTGCLARKILLNSMLFGILFALVFWGLRLTTLAPLLAFVCGIAVRALQQTPLRPAWILGTATPVAAALLSAGRLLSAGAESAFWSAALIRWIGLTSACYFLTLLCRKYDARYGDWSTLGT